MKRLIFAISLIVSAAACCMAQADGTQRVILKTARPISSVVVSGPAVVELKYDARHGGYIYYNTDNNAAPRIVAQSFDGDQLCITADSTANALATRITVLYDRPLTMVGASDRAIVVARRLVAASDVALVSDTHQSRSGIFIKELKADNVNLNLTDGDMGLADVNAKNLVVTAGNSSRLRLPDCRAANVEVNATGSSDVTRGGKVKNMLVNVDNTSAVHTLHLVCKSLTANLSGNGYLQGSTAKKVVVNQLGSGKITMRHQPGEVESNVGTDIIQIEK